MLGQYLSRSRFWKNILALMPELTETKLPKQSLLQILPSDSVRARISKPQPPHSATLDSLSVRNVHWPSAFDPNTSSAMGSIEQQSGSTFKPITLKEFESVFPQLVDDLSQHCQQYGLPDDALQWYKDVRSSSSIFPTASFTKMSTQWLLLALLPSPLAHQF